MDDGYAQMGLGGGFTKRMKRLQNLNVEKMATRGNSDIFMSERDVTSFGIIPLHLTRIQKEGFKIVGISGALPLPFHTRIGFNKHSMEKDLAALVDAETILVAHPPPFGIRDEVLGAIHEFNDNIADIVHAFVNKVEEVSVSWKIACLFSPDSDPAPNIRKHLFCSRGFSGKNIFSKSSYLGFYSVYFGYFRIDIYLIRFEF
jgi:hypothetical protein